MSAARPLEVLCLTWNIGHSSNASFPAHLLSLTQPLPADVIVIALEEIQDLGGRAERRMSELTSELISGFPPDFSVAFAGHHGGVGVFLFFRATARFQLNFEGSMIVPHDSMGETRGKASVVTRFTFTAGGTTRTMAVIGSHLECFDERFAVRNAEWHAALAQVPPSDYIVILGDLNYRIELRRQEVLARIAERNFKMLLRYDQLRRAKREDTQLAAFREGKIEFAPTYKFNEGSDEYDTSPKMRIPSYTDRVLVAWNNAPAPNIVEYNALDNRMSDHRPVRARLEFPCE
jgi:endonuclease/exonuclease/phosphatase family metal-dependent hydrolase